MTIHISNTENSSYSNTNEGGKKINNVIFRARLTTYEYTCRISYLYLVSNKCVENPKLPKAVYCSVYCF